MVLTCAKRNSKCSRFSSPKCLGALFPLSDNEKHRVISARSELARPKSIDWSIECSNRYSRCVGNTFKVSVYNSSFFLAGLSPRRRLAGTSFVPIHIIAAGFGEPSKDPSQPKSPTIQSKTPNIHKVWGL